MTGSVGSIRKREVGNRWKLKEGFGGEVIPDVRSDRQEGDRKGVGGRWGKRGCVWLRTMVEGSWGDGGRRRVQEMCKGMW